MNRNTLSTIALLLAAGTAANALADDVLLKRSVRMRTDRQEVTLADVAIIDGDYAATFAELVVGSFTDRTRPLELTVSDIETALDRAGANRARFDLSGNRIVIRPHAGTTQGNGPMACTPLAVTDTSSTRPQTKKEADEPKSNTTREASTVFDPRLVLAEDSPRGLIAERMLVGCTSKHDVRLRVRGADPSMLGVKDGRPSITGARKLPDGSMSFDIGLDGVPAGTVTGSLEFMIPVHRARIDLDRGTLVTPNDVSMLLEWTPSGLCEQRRVISRLVGTRIDKRVKMGTILDPKHFAPVVKRNDTLKVRCMGDSIITVDCIAMESGRIGETIEVRTDMKGANSRNTRPIRVVIRDLGLATIVN